MAKSTKTKAVVDASVILTRLLPDEQLVSGLDMYFERFAQNELDFLAPELLKAEVLNAIKTAHMRQRVSSEQIMELGRLFLDLPITYCTLDYQDVLQVAITYDITVYDATYVWLAQKHRIILVSLDQELITKQLAAPIPPVG